MSNLPKNAAQLDAIIEQYTDIVLERMDYQALEQYVYDSLIDYYSKMSKVELKEHIIEMENLTINDFLDLKGPVLITSSTYNWWLNCNHYGHFNQIHTHRKTDLVGLFYSLLT